MHSGKQPHSELKYSNTPERPTCKGLDASHCMIKECSHIIGIQGITIAESDILAQVAGPLGQVLVRLTGSGQHRFNGRSTDCVAIQPFLDLDAGTDALTVCLISTVQGDGFSILHPNEGVLSLDIYGGKYSLPNALTLAPLDRGFISYRGTTMRDGYHWYVLLDGIVGSRIERLARCIICQFGSLRSGSSVISSHLCQIAVRHQHQSGNP